MALALAFGKIHHDWLEGQDGLHGFSCLEQWQRNQLLAMVTNRFAQRFLIKLHTRVEYLYRDKSGQWCIGFIYQCAVEILISHTNLMRKTDFSSYWGDSSKRRNDVKRTSKILRYLIKLCFDVISTSLRHLEESPHS